MEVSTYIGILGFEVEVHATFKDNFFFLQIWIGRATFSMRFKRFFLMLLKGCGLQSIRPMFQNSQWECFGGMHTYRAKVVRGSLGLVNLNFQISLDMSL